MRIDVTDGPIGGSNRRWSAGVVELADLGPDALAFTVEGPEFRPALGPPKHTVVFDIRPGATGDAVDVGMTVRPRDGTAPRLRRRLGTLHRARHATTAGSCSAEKGPGWDGLATLSCPHGSVTLLPIDDQRARAMLMEERTTTPTSGVRREWLGPIVPLSYREPFDVAVERP